MKEWLLSVPKVAHFYWGGGTLPYMRMMTVKSFMRFNPDWKVKLYLPTQQADKGEWNTKELSYPVICQDCTDELMGLDIEKVYVGFAQYGFDDTMFEVHKSDFLRLYLLANEGGVWSDMDILYFKPMTELAVNNPENVNKDTFVCISSYGHSAGFLMSAPGSGFFQKTVELAKENYDPSRYQGIGATMFNERFPKFSDVCRYSPAVNIDMDAVYAHNAMRIQDIINGTPPKFTDKSIGIHWYAGHRQWGMFMRDTNGGKGNLSKDNVIGSVLLKLMDNE
jgi:hypothetical protein